MSYPTAMIRPFLTLISVGLYSLQACPGGLPDTGQAICYNATSTADCADTNYPRQDGSIVSNNALFTKIDAAGNELGAGAGQWSCVRDNSTGLVWEHKTTDGALHDVNYRYSWLNSDTSVNGGNAGANADVSQCNSTLLWLPCATEYLVSIVNERGLCGATDWRLPTQMELLTLVHSGNQNPTIDTSFFPNTAPVPYWSSTTYAMSPLKAWGVHFGYGAAHAELKSAPNAVRLVRGVWAR
jgi:hypothetical protein